MCFFKNGQGLTTSAYLSTPSVMNQASYPAIILLHGCSGVFSNSIPSKGIASLYKSWATTLTNLDYIVLIVDSFSSRDDGQNQCSNGSTGTSEVSDRPYDVVAAYEYLTTSVQMEGKLNSDKVGIMGWSHGGSTTMSTMSTVNHLGLTNPYQFKVAIAFYPGCGLYSAFGGISKSTWKNYAPLFILHGSIDSLYTGGYCDTRINRAKLIIPDVTLEMTVYDGAKHSFDGAKAGSSTWTAADLAAKIAADSLALDKFNFYLK